MVGQYDRQTKEYVFRAANGEPPPEFGVYLSEFAHMYRAALDNLLWQLVLLRGATPSRVTQFPIYEEESQFNGESDPKRINAFTQTEGVLPEDFALIEMVQPFKDRAHAPGPAKADRYAAWHPLALLAHLNNIDKHRFMHVGFAAVAPLDVNRLGVEVPAILADTGRYGLYRTPSRNVPSFGEPVALDGSIEPDFTWSYTVGGDDPAEIARVRGVKPVAGLEPKMEMKPAPTLDVSFSDRERPMTINDLIDIGTAVTEVVDLFRSAF